MSPERDIGSDLSSAGLILFNAATSYAQVAQSRGFDSLDTIHSTTGSWRTAFLSAFERAFRVDYELVFYYALKVAEIIPANSTSETALEKVVEAASFVGSNSGLLNLDLSGRVYHSTLGRDLAKAFATCYTTVPAGELLASLTVQDWKSRMCDFACGSGTLLVSAYHRKLALAFLQGFSGGVADLHKRFVEEDVWGFDAMPFAAHLSLVNLLLQNASATFDRSHIYHVSRRGTHLGSLDLLRGGKIGVQMRVDGGALGKGQVSLNKMFSQGEIDVPKESFDVILMNPPFTKKHRVKEVVDTEVLSGVVSAVKEGFTAAGGLPLPFILLGDTYLKPGGNLGLVLPSTCLSNGTWRAMREMFGEDYFVRHIVLNWVPGSPAFSDDSDIREVLLVVEKRSEGGNGNGSRRFSLVSHLDEPLSFTDARVVAEQLKSLESRGETISVRDGQTQILTIGSRAVGETYAVPVHLLEQTVSNWYRVASYRNCNLVRLGLLQAGLVGAGRRPPYGLDFSPFLSPLDDVCEVGLFVKSVGSAGFKVVDKAPSAGWAIPVVNTTSVTSMILNEGETEWLVRDHSLERKEKFNPGTGMVLVPRRTNLYSSLCVGAIYSGKPASGSMWIPAQPRSIKTSDGRPLSVEEVAKLVALWCHSTFGLVQLISERQETEGAWGEWLTEQTRQRVVLDPAKLSHAAVERLLDIWKDISRQDWKPLREQIAEAESSQDSPRASLDATMVASLLPRSSRYDGLYSDLGADLRRLREVM